MGLARLLILAQERLLGRGLASLLEPRFETHSIESFQRAGRLLGSDRVEIALWLGERLDAATIGQLDTLKRAHPRLRVCILARAADIDALRPLLRHDAFGVAVIHRSDELDVRHVVACLNDVLAGRSTLEPSVLERLLEPPRAAADDDVLSALTAGEREVLDLIAQGLRNREIGRRLWKSEKAIEKQVGHIFEKLGLDRRAMPHVDRRVTAARIFFSCRPESVAAESERGYAPRA